MTTTEVTEGTGLEWVEDAIRSARRGLAMVADLDVSRKPGDIEVAVSGIGHELRAVLRHLGADPDERVVLAAGAAPASGSTVQPGTSEHAVLEALRVHGGEATDEQLVAGVTAAHPQFDELEVRSARARLAGANLIEPTMNLCLPGQGDHYTTWQLTDRAASAGIG